MEPCVQSGHIALREVGIRLCVLMALTVMPRVFTMSRSASNVMVGCSVISRACWSHLVSARRDSTASSLRRLQDLRREFVLRAAIAQQDLRIRPHVLQELSILRTAQAVHWRAWPVHPDIIANQKGTLCQMARAMPATFATADLLQDDRWMAPAVMYAR